MRRAPPGNTVYIDVSGTAPDGLVWEFPWRDGIDPLDDHELDEDRRALDGMRLAS